MRGWRVQIVGRFRAAIIGVDPRQTSPERTAALRSLIDQMKQQLNLFELTIFEVILATGASFVDVALILEVSPGSVYVAFSRARARLIAYGFEEEFREIA